MTETDTEPFCRAWFKDTASLIFAGCLFVVNPIVSTRYGHPPFFIFWVLTGAAAVGGGAAADRPRHYSGARDDRLDGIERRASGGQGRSCDLARRSGKEVRATRIQGRKPMSIRPPFRADQVGSLLRSAPLKSARDKKAKGEISAAELTVRAGSDPSGRIRSPEPPRAACVTRFARSRWNQVT